MGMVATVAKLIEDVGEDGPGRLLRPKPEKIAAKLEAAKAEAREALAEIERLEAARSHAETWEGAEAADRQIAKQRWLADRAAAAIPDLERQLGEAKAKLHAEKLAKWKAQILGRVDGLRQAVREAARLQAEMMKLREAAYRDVGQNAVDLAVPHIGYKGLILPDLVALWDAELDKILAAAARPPARKRLSAPRPGDGMKPHAVYLRGSPPPRPGMEERQHIGRPGAVRLDAPTPVPPKRARNPDDTAPLEPGQARVRVLRAGYAPASDRPQCDRGQLVRMPRVKAERAQLAGAVEIIEEGPK